MATSSTNGSDLVKTSDEEEYQVIMSFDCQPSLMCPRFQAIQNHIKNFYDGHSFRFIDYHRAKKVYEQEFWYHAPVQLQNLKIQLLNNPTDHLTIDKYSLFLKLYKYQIEHPLYKFPDDPLARRSEELRIVNYIFDKSAYVLFSNHT